MIIGNLTVILLLQNGTSMKKVFVTGGCGLIGSKLCETLAKSGLKVVSFDNLSGPKKPYVYHKNITHIHGDILDKKKLLNSAEGCNIFFHLAAFGNVIDSIRDPSINFTNNVVGTLNCLDVAKQLKMMRFVFASTGGALMGNSEPPVTETSIPSPISPYGASKLACEGYCMAYASSYDLKTTIFRFGNVIGEFCFHKKGVLNTFVNNLLKGKEIFIYGDVSRDFIYSTDIVNALITAVKTNYTCNEIYHLCSGTETSITSFANIIAKTLNIPRDLIKKAPLRQGEVQRTFASAEKAKKEFGFYCEYELQKSVELTLRWLENSKLSLIN